MKTNSILNDVLGPVMAGPSSSHTAAPGKIGLAVRQLWGNDIACVRVIYEESGSYPSTHVGQGSDFGFAGGLLGMATDNPDFWNSLELAEKKGMDIEFHIMPLSASHPNEARIDVYEKESLSPAMSVLSYSTGGGTFLLKEMDGFAIENNGQRGHCYICAEKETAVALKAKLDLLGIECRLLCRTNAVTGNVVHLPQSAVLIDIELQSLKERYVINNIFHMASVIYLRLLPAMGAIEQRLKARAPFTTAAEAEAYIKTVAEKTAGTKREGFMSMAALAMDYEMGVCLGDREAIQERMEQVLSVMRRSMLPPPENWPVSTYILPKMSQKLKEMEKQIFLDLGVLNGAMSVAVSVMENSCVHRTVVAAPTAGSCGVIPATVVYLGEKLGCEDEKISDGLWAAGLIGVFIANEATFGAEVAGCQAEIGAAAAMAAAGIVELKGGTAIQGFHAAAIAMQSLMGLICDPVAGLTEFPCIERNVTAVNIAAASAEMVLCGMISPIPLDETILAMLEVGKMLPEELRCTCRGGLCTTATGRELSHKVEGKRHQS